MEVSLNPPILLCCIWELQHTPMGFWSAYTHFPNQFNEHYSIQSVKPQQPETASSRTSLPAGQPSPTHGPVRDITTHVLTSLLRGILDDPAFSQTLIYFSHPSPSPTSIKKLLLTLQSNLSFSSAGQSLGRGNSTAQWTVRALQDVQKPNPTHRIHCMRNMCLLTYVRNVLLNTLQNLMMEAVRGELVLTAHPRSVILPPVSTRCFQQQAAKHTSDPDMIQLNSVCILYESQTGNEGTPDDWFSPSKQTYTHLAASAGKTG
ncbi:hypothetical protein E3U43_015932 [Larimichthys crocea]|uniref:Uncharacterized protein n=1 Tax=Larimichthys crocea TaxID=215358 RepID=A0ACD3QI05_LARCR|nr:hypothetical protein E3U43_015932 [Larimichthys crocea]